MSAIFTAVTAHQIKSKNMSKGNVLLGVLAGFSAGAILGILFAPDKGSKTRNKISRKGREMSDDIKHKYNQLSDTVTAQYENVKDKAKHLGDSFKSTKEVPNADSLRP